MHDFTILALPGSYASSVAATVDLLSAAAAIAPRMSLVAPRWRVMSIEGGLVELGGGLMIPTRRLSRRSAADLSTWIVPGLSIADAEALEARLADADSALAQRSLVAHVDRGGRVAAACSAVFLLQAAGLLANRRATTSWWLAAELRRREPLCVVDAERMVCEDGLITTAGAAFAHTDLVLHLLRRCFGVALAEAVARALLIEARQERGQLVVPAMLAGGDALMARLVARIEASLPYPPGVETLASESAMSARTLSRHVRAATGQSTLALVQSVRANRARVLIETSRMTLEQVAEQVGYDDVSALRRLMRRVVGANPSHFRPVARERTKVNHYSRRESVA